MDKCPKCHAPARCGAPDGDFRYVPPKPQTTDLAQSLADALEIATDQLEKSVSGDRIDTKAVNQILERAALANYRKGEAPPQAQEE